MARNRNLDQYSSDTVYQKIESKYITLSDEDRLMCNEHLDAIIHKTVLPLMKQNYLFNFLYRRIVYGGSYYKGTKYDKPDEYDLDFVMDLPFSDNYEIDIITIHNKPGFAKLKLISGEFDSNLQYYSDELNNWISSNSQLNSYNFRKWVRGVLLSALDDNYKKQDNSYSVRAEGRTYKIKYRDTGPACTLTIIYGKIKISVDIVPCLEFEIRSLGNEYRSLNRTNKAIMFIPKPLDGHIADRSFLWRLSFYQQEKELLDGRVKSTIKMMKKFRDTKRWDKLASYYIETIFYHTISSFQNNGRSRNRFLNCSKTTLFMRGLFSLKEALENRRLPYFWNENHDLFRGMSNGVLDDYTNQLNRVINDIERRYNRDPYVLASHILKRHEFKDLKGTWRTKILEFFGYRPSRSTFGLGTIDYCMEWFDQFKYYLLIGVLIYILNAFGII